jgi:WD40 repeat protein
VKSEVKRLKVNDDQRGICGEQPMTGRLQARRGLQDYRRFLGAEAAVLKRDPELFFQQAANQPDTTRPAIDAAARLRDGRERRPWLRWVDNPLNRSACHLTLTEHRGCILRIAFSPPGDLLVSASSDASLTVWEAETGVDLARLEGHRGPVRGCAFSSDGSRILSASADRTLRIWDVETRATVSILRGHAGEVTACAFSPDGCRAVSSSRDGTVRVWDAVSGSELVALTGHRQVVESCAWSPDGTRIVSGSWSELKIWDAAAGVALGTLAGHSYLVTDCLFSPDGSRLASASLDGGLKLWDVEAGREIITLEGHTDAVWACAFSPDGQQLLSASSDGTLRVWDVSAGTELLVLGAHRSPVTACAFSPDGRSLASGATGELKLWATPERSDLRLLADRRAETVSFSRDGRWIGTTFGEAVTVRSGETGDHVATLKGHSKWVKACAFSPDGRRVVSASADETLKIWKLPSGAEVGTLIGHRGTVEKVVFSPDGTRVLSKSDDFGQLSAEPRGPNLWDPATSTLIGKLDGFKLGELAPDQVFAPDGTRLLTGSGPELRLIDSVTGKGAGVAARHEAHVYDFAFSPDGTRIVSVAGKTVRISDARGSEQFQLRGHQDELHHCGFSADGSLAFSRGKDGALKVWDADAGMEIATLADEGGSYLKWGATADGTRLIVPFDKKLTLWKMSRTGELEIVQACPRRVSWSLSPGAEWIALSWDEEWVVVWETQGGREIARYPVSRFGRPEGWGPDGRALAIVDDYGFRLLRLENVNLAARPACVWRADGGRLKVGCPVCSAWFDVGREALGLERRCASCGCTLRLLNRIVSGDWRRIAAAWRLPVVTAWRDAERGTIMCGCPLCQHRLELTPSNLGEDTDCPSCRESFRLDHLTTPGRPAPKVDAAEELKRQSDLRFQQLLGEIAVMEKTGLFDRVDEIYGGQSAKQRSSTSTLDLLETLTSSGGAESSAARGAAKGRKKKPWWKFW